MERNHQHLSALAGFSILLLEPNQGGTCAIDKETGVAISYPIEFASFVGYLSAVPISVGPTVLDIIPTLNVYNSGNRENFGVWVRQNGVHITISIKWLAVGY